MIIIYGDSGLDEAESRMTAREGRASYLSGEEVLDLLDQHIASDVGDCLGEGQLLWAGLDAVLREAALLDSTLAGQRAQAFCLEHRAGGVHVEELDLGEEAFPVSLVAAVGLLEVFEDTLEVGVANQIPPGWVLTEQIGRASCRERV